MPDGSKTPSESMVEMTQLVMPSDANVLGTAFGGKVMQWTDLTAAMVAMRHARMPVVTASIDRLSFLSPVRIGHVALLRGRMNAVFGSSMEIEVEVLTENPLSGERHRCCTAFVTFVCLDAAGRPAPAPRLCLESQDEQRREREARHRRDQRLTLRAREADPG
jgi:acyl-CoA hydrolase